MTDKHNRTIKKLRVSLTDVCNFRCFYCMPQDAKFMNKKELLNINELKFITSILLDAGIEEIRLTGGEPTMRTEFEEIAKMLSSLPLKKLSLTTNALTLDKHLKFLKTQTKVKSINISLDSLNKTKFEQITKTTNTFDKVMNAIHQAKEMGFEVKINTVLMKTKNDDEILDFVKFSSKYNIEVRFLELMKIGQSVNNILFMSANDAIEIIKHHSTLKIKQQNLDSTSFNFINNDGANIGFIASESQPFCGNCSRWRLSANGYLRACLMSELGLSLKNKTQKEIISILPKVLDMKPIDRIYSVDNDMYTIGG